jgi:hypothetical protein
VDTDEALADLLTVVERDRKWLHVDPLAETDVRAQVGQRVDVLEAPSKAGLENDADVVSSCLAKLAVQEKRGVGAARVLHVDANEYAPRSRVRNHRGEQRATELEIDLEPESGQLDGHVGVEVVARDGVEGSVVGTGDRHCLLRASYLLA